LSKDSIGLEFLKRTDKTPDWPAYGFQRNGTWENVTFGELRLMVERIFHWLIEQGIKQEDKVSVLSENSMLYVTADYAAMTTGATSVPIYPTNTTEQVGFVLSHSESIGIFASTKSQAEKALAVLEECPKIQWIVVLNPGEHLDHPRVLHLDQVLEQGEKLRQQAPDKFAQTVKDLDDHLICTMIYTSGTTGPPKGTMLSHKACLAACNAAIEIFPPQKGDRGISYLPMCHVFGRIVEVFSGIMMGAHWNITSSMDDLMTDIKHIKPTSFNSVPRLYEKIYNGIYEKVAKAPSKKKKIFHWAVATGKAYIHVKYDERKQPGVGLRIKHAIAEKLVLSKLREKIFGGDMRFVISGAAPLAEEILRFMHAIGVCVLEGYGMTESAAMATVNQLEPGMLKFGTVGKAAPGMQLRIAEDGEILIKGDNLMTGYFKEPEATAEAIKDGWLYSGDLGAIDEEGFLRITGRKKEIIITAGGKNITPVNIEMEMKLDPYIDEFVAYGDQRKCLTGLLAPDFQALEKWAAEQGLRWQDHKDLTSQPQVVEHLRARVAKINKQLPSYETIKDIVVIPRPFSLKTGELTPTNKVKRQIVYENYMSQLNALYAHFDAPSKNA